LVTVVAIKIFLSSQANLGFGQAAEVAQAGVGIGRMSGAERHITRDEELARRHDRRHYAAERHHEPVTDLGWELLDACPGLEPEAAERSGDLLDRRP
jgi:hypothetical protein